MADYAGWNSSGFPINTEFIHFPSTGKPEVLSNLRRIIRLPFFLRNKKIDRLLSLDGKCFRNISVPQSIFITDFNNINRSCFSLADNIWVLSGYAKKKILSSTVIPQEKIEVIHPAVPGTFHSVTTEEKAEIKKKITEGYDFFLYNGPPLSPNEFILLLKAYSIFKNRQKSNLKFVFLSEQDDIFQKYLLHYKYKEDVKIIRTLNEELPAQLTAAAYAVILPGENEWHLLAAIQAAQSNVPVITVTGSAIDECMGTAVLSAVEKTPKEIGGLMMRLYTDEQLRGCLIEKGRALANKFSFSHTAGILWQSVEKC